jgi:hypothetical protein
MMPASEGNFRPYFSELAFWLQPWQFREQISVTWGQVWNFLFISTHGFWSTSFLCVLLEFELTALCLLGRHSYCLSYFISPFLWFFFFRDRCPELFAHGWLWTMILLIFAS